MRGPGPATLHGTVRSALRLSNSVPRDHVSVINFSILWHYGHKTSGQSNYPKAASNRGEI